MNLIVNYGVSSIKLGLVVLFIVLGMGELSDGIYDVGDYAVPLLVCLLINDLYFNYKSGNLKATKSSLDFKKKSIKDNLISFISDIFYSGSSENMKNGEKGLKIIMNNIFLVLFISPLIMQDLNFSYEVKSEIFKLGVIIWSGIFLSVSISDFRKSLKLSRLVFSNMAFLILLGSLILL
ncbi:MAG: hypothetical protein HN576_01435 [Bacteriovoracaceae bacterium]|jgi:hypothetical protein|nr:hypothetical protein [Bacteriovoracaceae bacterium]